MTDNLAEALLAYWHADNARRSAYAEYELAQQGGADDDTMLALDERAVEAFNDWQDARRAVRTELKPGGAEWQPINTAPKDGTPVLGGNHAWVCEVHYAEGYGWYEKNNYPTDSWGGETFPTHWMPLPQPPVTP
jgi:hypothetical protein